MNVIHFKKKCRPKVDDLSGKECRLLLVIDLSRLYGYWAFLVQQVAFFLGGGSSV